MRDDGYVHSDITMTLYPSTDLDFNDPQLREDPYSVYRHYRESKPIVWSDKLNGWLIFRYEDVYQLLNDPRSSNHLSQSYLQRAPSSRRKEVQPMIDIISRWVAFLDGSDHTRLRKLINHGFAPRVVTGLMPVITDVVDEILDSLAGRTQFDICQEFTYLVPMRVIDDMLCVPPEKRSSSQQWTDDTIRFISSVPLTEEICDRALVSFHDMINHFEQVVADRKANPKDDFLSFLIHAEEDGDVLSAQDLLANLQLLLQAGNETTRNLIGNAIYQLLLHPQTLKQVRNDPTLWNKVVDETLRYDAPVQIISKVAREKISLGGQSIAKGQIIFLVLGSANRDNCHFINADEFSLDRDTEHHLAFSSGPHYCVGNYLAKAEATIALEKLFFQFLNIELDPRHPKEWFSSTRFRGLSSLPVLCK